MIDGTNFIKYGSPKILAVQKGTQLNEDELPNPTEKPKEIIISSKETTQPSFVNINYSNRSGSGLNYNPILPGQISGQWNVSYSFPIGKDTKNQYATENKDGTWTNTREEGKKSNAFGSLFFNSTNYGQYSTYTGGISFGVKF